MSEVSETKLPDITDARDLAGKYVLLRASLNVPVRDGVVQNRFRLTRSLPTIQYLSAHGARVIVVGHIGREPGESLRPVYDVLQDLIPLSWCDATSGARVKSERDALSDGDVLLLENLRSNEGETTNDDAFARELAGLADLYVNDAFAASHRAHASIVGVPKHLPTYFGSNFIREVEVLSSARDPLQPALFILGGAKFETKLPLLEEYLGRYEHVFVGGALAHDIWRAQGFDVGTSLVSDSARGGTAVMDAPNLLLPVDVTVKHKEYTRVTTPDSVKKDEMIVDAGPKTVALLQSYAAAARTILWNGPLGNYELGFATVTERTAHVIANSAAHSIVGGGDTIASIEALCLEDRFDFLSTAGGAMLAFLKHGTLPAIDAVRER